MTNRRDKFIWGVVVATAGSGTSPARVRLRHQAEEGTVSVETPRPTGFDDFDSLLIVAVKDLIGHTAIRGPGTRE